MERQRDIEEHDASGSAGPGRATTTAVANDLQPSSGGMELALAAGLAVGLGYWLDGIFGIRPILTLVLFFWAVLSLGVILYYRYRADMERLEADQVWNLTPDPASSLTPDSVAPTDAPDFNGGLA